MVCWEEQALKGKEKQILSSYLLCFYWFKMIMKHPDETSFVTISLEEAPSVCCWSAFYDDKYLPRQRFPHHHHPSLFPDVKGFLCLILTCLNFLMFFQSSTAVSKPPLFCWVAVSLVFWVVTLYARQKKKDELGCSVLLFSCNCIFLCLHGREWDCSPHVPR